MNLLKQSTAVSIALGPFVDSTDGVTAETALTIAQADVRLKKNDGAWAQKAETTSATHEENGWYEVPLDTTDTGTLGILMVAVNESGALPVWREFLVVPAEVYDTLVGGTDKLTVDLNFALSLPASPTADTVGDALKQATHEEAPKKNTALSDIPFYMVDDTDGKTPETGLTVTAEVSLDGAAFAAAAGTVTEIGSGVYHFDATQADMNGDVVVLKFTATGARAAIIAFQTVE